jgi:hypothetical protein
MLLAKLRYEPEEFNDEDWTAAHYIWEDLLERTAPRQDARYSRYRYVILHLLGFNGKLAKWIRDRSDENFQIMWWTWPPELRSFLLGPYEYFGMKYSEYKDHWPHVRFVKQPLRKVQQRFIGVGYKDKGSSRNKSIDGSPSIEEICRDERFRNLNTVHYSCEDPPDIGFRVFGEVAVI